MASHHSSPNNQNLINEVTLRNIVILFLPKMPIVTKWVLRQNFPQKVSLVNTSMGKEQPIECRVSVGRRYFLLLGMSIGVKLCKCISQLGIGLLIFILDIEQNIGLLYLELVLHLKI